MMFKKITILLMMSIITTLMMSCQENNETTPGDERFIFIYDMLLDVDEIKTVDIQTNIDGHLDITYTYQGDAIHIDKGRIYGVKAGTETIVTASYENLSAYFKVVIPEDNITISGSLFDDIEIEKIDALNNHEDFIMGVDLSSIVEVIKRGGKFYNHQGVRTSIYQLLKNQGVNYIRIRLWNDPKSPSGTPYGGGNNDIEVAKQIGHDAKMFGMKILLDFHYSDFWADPGKQIIPKAWANLETPEAISQALYDFTYESMQAMEDAGAKVDMVQIGNEIAPGLLTQGTNSYETLNTDNPNRFQLPQSISGSTSNLSNFIMYLNAGLTAAKAQNPDVLTMIHIDRGGNNAFYRTYFDRIEAANLDFDIIGMSYYIFYHGSLSNFEFNIRDIAQRYGKPIIIAETSYAFTNQNVANASHILTTSFGGYPLTVQGQADVTRDIINIVASVPNELGIGIFYWEPAWLPVAGAGWAGVGTPGTWANQALFSYQGIELPSLRVFKKVYPDA
ncbi:MAG: glycosyl hydrolase [Tenericutes bacterium HGW-Tenericutes-6]|nr:MAG: glycosyl hydrolase [Tenericutes bacterium HGW-Tenericutes-6]